MDTRDDCRCGHEFVLVLSGITDIDDPIADALFEAGCDDSTPCLRSGRVYLSFNREAPSLREAILSAIRDVLGAGIGAGVEYVDGCNLVSQADIARRIGRSRQFVGQYVSGKRGPGNFPGPVCDVADGHALWRWCDVSDWLWRNGLIGEDVLNNSRVVATINSVLEYRHQQGHDADLAREVLRMVEGTPASCHA